MNEREANPNPFVPYSSNADDANQQVYRLHQVFEQEEGSYGN